MLHCPYCGTKVKDNELYCIKCGKQLPEDRNKRLNNQKVFNKSWYIPISIAVIVLLSSGIYYIFLQNQSADAKDLYNKAEDSAINGQYEEAEKLLKSTLENVNEFSQADIAMGFVQKALHVKANLDEATALLDKDEFQKALSLVNQAEDTLNTYNGKAVTPLINKLTSTRSTIKTEEIKYKLRQDPSVDDLKALVWEAERIKSDNATDITATIRHQIVDYTYSKASEKLNEKQFSNALTIVEDGLKYASESEKLQSLKTTLEKEKTAFETAQRQRIEQAINSAEKERKLNKNNAIELNSTSVESDDQGKLVVKGEVKSVGTIPINTILVEYSLLSKKGKAFLSNKVYVYPDTLYPDETGEFEFTHFDIDKESKDIDIRVDKIKWYTDK